MNIELTGRHINLDDEIKTFAEKKLHKIEKFLEEPVEMHLILDAEKLRKIAELHITHRFGVLQATEEAEDLHDAIHAVVETATKQARRARKKFIDQRRRADRVVEEESHWPVEVLDRETFGGEDRPRVIKTHRLPIKPMTLEEASQALETSKNEFFVFLDASTERVNVLYRRKDENFGLIAPEI